ncbi:MAG: hypothetical protein IIB95_14220 [Candidatus Marinimicrobia bacterium]|nr:hypothetical protein [Candidatus Neomarinimicrobiota bacterium]
MSSDESLSFGEAEILKALLDNSVSSGEKTILSSRINADENLKPNLEGKSLYSDDWIDFLPEEVLLSFADDNGDGLMDIKGIPLYSATRNDIDSKKAIYVWIRMKIEKVKKVYNFTISDYSFTKASGVLWLQVTINANGGEINKWKNDPDAKSFNFIQAEEIHPNLSKSLSSYVKPDVT